MRRVCARRAITEFTIQRTVADQGLQRLAVEELHDNERLPFVLPHLVEGADVGMVQGRSGVLRGGSVREIAGLELRPPGRNFRATKRPSSMSSVL